MSLRSTDEMRKFPGCVRIRDVVRGAILCSRTGSLRAALDLIIGCDRELSSNDAIGSMSSTTAGLTTKIVTVGIKNRLRDSTIGGWSVCMRARGVT